jgi:hypothetical protein
MTPEDREEIFDAAVGSITVRELVANLDLSEGPIRVDIPMCLSISVRDQDALLEYLGGMLDGREEGWDDYGAGTSDDRLYVGWDTATARFNDVAYDWEESDGGDDEA